MREYNYCLRCGRKLKSKENRLRGYGSVCYEKSKLSSFKPLFEIDKDKTDLQKLKNDILDNDAKFNLGIITESEYQKNGKDLMDKVSSLEIKLLKGGIE